MISFFFAPHNFLCLLCYRTHGILHSSCPSVSSLVYWCRAKRCSKPRRIRDDRHASRCCVRCFGISAVWPRALPQSLTISLFCHSCHNSSQRQIIALLSHIAICTECAWSELTHSCEHLSSWPPSSTSRLPTYFSSTTSLHRYLSGRRIATWTTDQLSTILDIHLVSSPGSHMTVELSRCEYISIAFRYRLSPGAISVHVLIALLLLPTLLPYSTRSSHPDRHVAIFTHAYVCLSSTLGLVITIRPSVPHQRLIYLLTISLLKY